MAPVINVLFEPLLLGRLENWTDIAFPHNYFRENTGAATAVLILMECIALIIKQVASFYCFLRMGGLLNWVFWGEGLFCCCCLFFCSFFLFLSLFIVIV